MISVIGNGIDIESVISQYHMIEEKIQWMEMPPKGKQAGLQYADETSGNLWGESTGKFLGLANPEPTFKNLNPLLTGTIFEEIINEHKLVRTRFMWLNGMSCYSMHRDMSPRIHIPIITNPACYFVFRDSKIVEHMPAGDIYWTDTRQAHTFMNCSAEPRLHLIGVPDVSLL
jgi:hypothetical protein